MSGAARCNRLATSRLAAGLGAALLLVGCESEAAAPTRPLVLIGIDGADWGAIERLWSEGKLPHLKALAERGTRLPLGSDYASRSPVVWTTIATGVAPQVHGIEDFIVTTDEGDVPLASTLRKVPALWNILTDAGRKVAVLGWWASWPAEDIAGVVVSDRCFLETEDAVHPPEFSERFEREAAELLASRDPNEEDLVKRDLVVGHFAPQLAAEGFDLVMAYFKMVDRTCHVYWKYFDPDSFPPIPADEMEANRHRVAAAYEEVDAVVGRIVAAAAPDTNFLVVSDHGMRARIPEKLRVSIDVSPVLERLGLLERHGTTSVDFAQSLVFPYGASHQQAAKPMRFSLAGREAGGHVLEQGIPQALAEVEAAMARVTYASGLPTFAVRPPTEAEARKGGDFVLEVLTDQPSWTLMVDQKPLEGAVQWLRSISGHHSAHDDGILIAAGPDFAEDVDLEVSIHGICPTILYALGLPVAEDGLRPPYRELFTRAFRREQPVRKVPSYGTRDAGGVRTSAADAELIEELRQVGYLR